MIIIILNPETNQPISEFKVNENTTFEYLKKIIKPDTELQIPIAGSDVTVSIHSLIPDNIKVLDYLYYNSHYAVLGDRVNAYIVPQKKMPEKKSIDEKAINQIYRNRPRDYFHILTPQAFAKADEIKSLSTNDHKKIYKTSHYPFYPKFESDKKIECMRFEKQMFEIVDKIIEWAKENKVNIDTERNESILLFKDQIFSFEYSGNQSASYFEVIKKNLESIWLQLNNSTLAIDFRRMQCEDLIDAFGVCNGGIYTHIETIYYSLNQNTSLNRFIADRRTEIVKEYSIKKIVKRQVSQQDSIHIHNAFFKYCENEGWNPVLSTVNLNDKYIQDLLTKGLLSTSDFPEFHQYFVDQFTPEFIIKNLVHKYKTDIDNLADKLGIKIAKNGWIKCDRDYNLYVERVTAYFKAANVNLTMNDIFAFNDDFTEVRFDSKLFYDAVFRYCLTNKLFTPDAFLLNSTVYSYNHFLIENEYDTINKAKQWNAVVYQDLPDLLAAIINKTPSEHCEKLIAFLEKHPWFDKLCKDDKLLNVFLNIEDDIKCFILANNKKISKAKIFSNLDLFSKLLTKFSVDEWLKLYSEIYSKNTQSKFAANALLNSAIKNNNLDIIKRLSLDTTVNFNNMDGAGFTALETAIMHKKHEIVDYLINTIKVDLNKKSKHGYPISFAIIKNNFPALKSLVKGSANLHVEDKSTAPILHLASETNLTFLKYLILEAKLDPESKDESGNTILHNAISNNQFDNIKFLIEEQKINMEAVDSSGYTPLHLACSLGLQNVAEYLISKKANLNSLDQDGETPLHIAARNDPDLVSMLLDAKANVHVKNREEELTPLAIAKLQSLELQSFDQLTKLANAQIITLLKKAELNTSTATPTKGGLFEKKQETSTITSPALIKLTIS